jgi:hypothetical protein
MSLYEELHAAYLTTRASVDEIRDQTWEFAGRMVVGLAAHIECPDDSIRVVPPGVDHASVNHYSVGAAMTFRDGAWDFDVILTLKRGEGRTRFEACDFRIPFRIKRGEDGFDIDIGKMLEKTIDPTQQEDFDQLFDEIVNSIRDDLEKQVDKYLTPDVPRRIGF